ncbi:MAG: class I SAM-dependent methyltransferase [Lachnospiraceae bacterium]|nr:class I SAM-dependent methyltransferase [Lachnospiraceae bacterium]
MKEKIGQVTLDYTWYPGEDFYCDGEVEKELLELVMKEDAASFDRIIRERRDWPTLYHLSPQRGNIVSWLPFSGTEKVLEVGAGPGAITGALAPAVGQITCVDLSKVRSQINAYRNRDCANLEIKVGNFEDIEPHLDDDYDYIFLIGVFEYSTLYIHDRMPFHEELRRLLRHRKPGGRIVIAIENRTGMKYFAGCAEDHTGRYFDGIEGYPNPSAPARTFSRRGLEQIFLQCGVGDYTFYYPYPDYKLMHTLYSDWRLPACGELTDNIRNFDRDRLLLFDEKKAFDAVIREGEFPVFSNSYEVILGPPPAVRYCRFSTERAPRYRIRTVISGQEVLKQPEHPEAREHVRQMEAMGRKLAERFEGSGLQIAACRYDAARGAAVFPYISGRSLTELLDERLREADTEGLFRLLLTYREYMSYREDVPAADPDMIFANILVRQNADGSQEWTAIDYEWAQETAIPADRMLIRALSCWFREDESRKDRVAALIGEEAFYEHLHLNPAEAAAYEESEDFLQDKVTDQVTALGELRHEIGGKVIVPAELAAGYLADKNRAKQAVNLATVQIYTDTGNGFREEESRFVEQNYGEEGVICFEVKVPESVRALRIDPALCPCVAALCGAQLVADGAAAGEEHLQTHTKLFRKYAQSNGIRTGESSFLFATQDPNLVWDMNKLRRKTGVKKDAVLRIRLQMAGLPATLSEQISQDGIRSTQ